MDPIYTFLLSAWGATVATTLAIIQIIKAYRDKPEIRVKASLGFRPTDESGTIKGTRMFDEERGFHQEILLQITAANYGNKPLQIISIAFEEDSTGMVTQVHPEKLPVVLDPGSSISVAIQKEWLDDGEVTSFGVVDALGKRHTLSKRELEALKKQSAELPTNIGTFRRKDDPNEVVQAFQTTDPFVITNRRKPGREEVAN